MQQVAQRHRRIHTAVKHRWTSFLRAARAHRPRREVVPPAAAGVDPVVLTMLAVNRLGPATLRSATHGRAYTVAVPDARTAEIFYAALQEMQKTRRTDRLVDIIVTEEPLPRMRGRDVGDA